MVRRLSTLAVLAMFLVPTALVAAEAPARRPNVLFLFSDDQRADTVATPGSPANSPNVDALAARGTVLTRVYCNGGLEGAICLPSRAMLMSGRGLFRIDRQLKGQGTWPEAFGEAGYATFATGKWHNGPESLARSFQRAEAIFMGGMGDPYKLPLQDLGPDGKLGPRRLSGEHSVKLFADAAVRFLKDHQGDAPFLCYVAFNSPHDPRVTPPEYRAKYHDADLPLPANFLPDHPFDNGELKIRDEELAPHPRTPGVVRKHLGDYYASIEYLDAQVGRILEALRDAGHEGDTIVVFASDHGLAIGSHGLMGKQNLYEHSMRAPAVLAGPGVPVGRRIDAIAYLHDLFPTLGELAGVAGPEGSEGLSLVPVLKGETRTRRTDVLTAYRDVQRAIRDERWKLIVYPRVNRVQLFDLRDDPDELHDLSADPEHADEVVRLAILLRRRQAEAGDVQPLESDRPAAPR